jgi:hypothetical protein
MSHAETIVVQMNKEDILVRIQRNLALLTEVASNPVTDTARVKPPTLSATMANGSMATARLTRNVWKATMAKPSCAANIERMLLGPLDHLDPRIASQDRNVILMKRKINQPRHRCKPTKPSHVFRMQRPLAPPLKVPTNPETDTARARPPTLYATMANGSMVIAHRIPSAWKATTAKPFCAVNTEEMSRGPLDHPETTTITTTTNRNELDETPITNQDTKKNRPQHRNKINKLTKEPPPHPLPRSQKRARRIAVPSNPETDIAKAHLPIPSATTVNGSMVNAQKAPNVWKATVANQSCAARL